MRRKGSGRQWTELAKIATEAQLGFAVVGLGAQPQMADVDGDD